MTDADRRRIVAWLLKRIDATDGAPQTRWRHLQAAHIAGQPLFTVHAMVHLHMLRQAWRDRDPREVAGQLLRLALVPLGHATGRLPIGNSGRSDVSAFSAMAVRPDLAMLLSQAARQAAWPATRQQREP